MATSNRAATVTDMLLTALGLNAPYVLDLYSLYAANPETVSADWRRYFEGLERGDRSVADVPRRGDAPGNGSGTRGAPKPAASSRPAPVLGAGDTLLPLTGGSAALVAHMEASRSIPTATSYRRIPVKVLEENRRLINHHRAMVGGSKLSFTHFVAWAIVRALAKYPALNDAFVETEGVPQRWIRSQVRLGIAVDLVKRDGTRTLLVPNIPAAESLDFPSFVQAYDRLLDRTRRGKLDPIDLEGTTLSLTNPGTVGTDASVPRLLEGQGAILAVGSIGYSAETRAMSPELLSRLGISKQMTLSCTYDHRIVQGAVSGEFLGEVERLLTGDEGFYDAIFAALAVPYHPLRWTPDVAPSALPASGVDEITRQARVLQLINAYRVRGHLIADLDPLGSKLQYHAELDINFYGLTLWDLDRTFITGAEPGADAGWAPEATLREILETVRAAYCGRIGIEYMNIQDPEQKFWIQERVESASARAGLEPALRRRILDKLIESETFEHFLHRKYLGHKRFSLEGGETLIVVLDQLLEEAAAQNIEEVVMGMAHRGRLNALACTLGVDPARIFFEFQGTRDPNLTQGSGDVKYHFGALGRHRAENGALVRLSLAPNPSHLEAVDPVVEGIARAKQERMGVEEGRRRILPVLVHGDAAFAGQGVVAETLNLSQLRGYRTGGTVHIIVNNQIGFTTPVESARSSPYATDVAKMCQAPIFHVNGDDPEAAVRVLRWAFLFRQVFQKDVVIDIFCYRRHGHNEGDEPSYTQPRLYAKIRNHPSVADLYGRALLRAGVLDATEVDAMRAAHRARLEDGFDRAQKNGSGFTAGPLEPVSTPGERPRTGVPRTVLARITAALVRVPEGLDLHPKLRKWMDARQAAMATGRGIDWAFAEALAFGSVVLDGFPVRLSGQDSVRGTFSQRHLLLHDDDTDLSWMALQHLAPEQAPFHAVDSPLSEEAVLAFDYGFTLGDPRALVLWEAQFGDFVNEAQVVIDQFLAGSEAKWGQPSGLVLLLPHGYEGQGPDHSSARLERFLQLAAEENLRVVNCTTPAQYFHLLRRQALDGVRKPLVVMTPKSLLRHPRAVSEVGDLEGGAFQPLLVSAGSGPVTRLLLVSGKLAYELEEAREKQGRNDVGIVRVEELYPFPEASLRGVLATHSGARLTWVQEEPRNMGAWSFMQDRLRRSFGIEAGYVGRPESAATATGYLDVHAREQARVVQEALAS
jgi:multifunctional 2-oxoglutarate metabolism enzyme